MIDIIKDGGSPAGKIKGSHVFVRLFLVLALFLAGCSSHKQQPWDPVVPVQRAMQWSAYTNNAATAYGVDWQLVTAIIAVESGGNPNVVSKSNAVGLMQIKASTAGKDVYRRWGWGGQPSNSSLKNPQHNINVGTAYLSILEHGPLAGIRDPATMRYALAASYANGAGALLRIFSSDRQDAIEDINDMSPQEFYDYIVDNHPSAQAPRYLYKVTRALNVM